MSLIDYNNRLTPTAQQFNATAVTTNSQPLGATGLDLSNGEPMSLVFHITVAGAKAGTEAYTFQVVSATASDGTTGQVVIGQTGTFTASSGTFAQRSQLAAGDFVHVPIPANAIPSTATHLAGKVVIASSGDITCLVDIVPTAEVAKFIPYTAQPSLQ
jgi:hypothetical protein